MIGSEFAIFVSSVNAMVVVLNCTATGEASTVTLSVACANLQRRVHGDVAARLHQDVPLHEKP